MDPSKRRFDRGNDGTAPEGHSAEARNSRQLSREFTRFIIAKSYFKVRHTFRGARAEARDKMIPGWSLAGELARLTAHLLATRKFSPKVTLLVIRAARVALN